MEIRHRAQLRDVKIPPNPKIKMLNLNEGGCQDASLLLMEKKIQWGEKQKQNLSPLNEVPRWPAYMG